ncbi:hypothetical protein [Janthinobacterium lividum]|uniref:hypothetical protein n=1 Tax=Janthinobacterium lividum TaxID=29581 RepID=UPI0008755474|nr:hypothetical protein [Janthinobacterium lividum]MCC7712968.1 hypothetical protein [Janthinobacterium lividum]OEZ55697.1 hypothetical protein JANLI_30910 [Janthinobacterium lividum]WQE31405.1 hypothetical protein U0004_13640 [Janthinobacterium lividum]STQ96935.1 Uncharacterised protein [Janthinobacterium lividum]
MSIWKQDATKSGRRLALGLMACGLLLPLAACGQAVKKEIWLNVEMVSYVDRPIFDIIFNGTDLGVMDEYGSTGTITEVRIPFGIQALKWTLDGPKDSPRNGEVVTIKNQLVISAEQIPLGTRYFGLHLYPDDTAEITFADFIPERTARGEKILAARKK